MMFDKSDIRYEDIPEWNNRRIAAAKRALKKERERAGLFGEELMRFKSVEERQTQINERSYDFVHRMREYDTRTWREARAYYYSLSKEGRLETKQYWEGSRSPKEAFRFADLITQLRRDPKYIKRKIGLASPYTRDIIINGQLHVIEITKQEHDEFINRSYVNIDANKRR